MTEFCDGNRWHYVTNPDAYLSVYSMYEMRTCSADPKDGYRLYVDPQFATQRAMIQPRAGAYLHYQFPYEQAGSPERQADFFCDALGSLRANEMVMLDTEDGSGLSNPAEFVARWCSRVEPRLNTLAWIYVPRGLSRKLTREITGNRIVKAPRYSGHAGKGNRPDWPHDVWQYTDRGHFPGSPHGPGDCNTTDLTTAQLLSRCKRVEPARPTLRIGSRGEHVRYLQECLNAS